MQSHSLREYSDSQFIWSYGQPQDVKGNKSLVFNAEGIAILKSTILNVLRPGAVSRLFRNTSLLFGATVALRYPYSVWNKKGGRAQLVPLDALHSPAIIRHPPLRSRPWSHRPPPRGGGHWSPLGRCGGAHLAMEFSRRSGPSPGKRRWMLRSHRLPVPSRG